MAIKITPQQAKKVNALLRKLCANYNGGNCLLLDDGEPCVCVQSISKYGIYCNYFKNAVLPVDEGLHAEIMKPTGGKRCVLCRQSFAPRAKNQRYCPACFAVCSILSAPSMAPSIIGRYSSGQSFSLWLTRCRCSLSSRMISGLKYRSTGSPQTLINWIITGRLGIAP